MEKPFNDNDEGFEINTLCYGLIVLKTKTLWELKSIKKSFIEVILKLQEN